jgi:hypothetical protein
MGKSIPSYKPEVRFDFEKNKSYPRNMDSLDLEEEVTVTVTGKIKSLRKDEWGRSFSMTIGKVDVVPRKQKPKGVSEVMEQMKNQRRL